MATQREARYVHSGNEPKLLAGVGTAGLEILDERPDVDRVFCPVGGGTAAAGYCTTLGAMTDADVVGVQAAGAPAVYRAWQDETLDALDSVDTIAEGVATRRSVRAPDRNPAGGTRRFPTRVRRRHYRCLGDWVEIDDAEGIVTDITIINTRLSNADGETVVFPNDRVTERS